MAKPLKYFGAEEILMLGKIPRTTAIPENRRIARQERIMINKLTYNKLTQYEKIYNSEEIFPFTGSASLRKKHIGKIIRKKAKQHPGNIIGNSICKECEAKGLGISVGLLEETISADNVRTGNGLKLCAICSRRILPDGVQPKFISSKTKQKIKAKSAAFFRLIQPIHR